MQKLFAIFLAIGVVNAAVVSNQSLKAKPKTLTVFQTGNGGLARLFGIYEAYSLPKPIADINAVIKTLINNQNVTTVGPVLIEVANLFNIDLLSGEKGDILEAVYNQSVNLKTIAKFLNKSSGELDYDGVLVVLVSVVDGLFDTIKVSQNEQVTGGLLSGKRIVNSDKVLALYEKLDANGASFGVAVKKVLKLFHAHFYDEIKPDIFDLNLDLIPVINTLRLVDEKLKVEDAIGQVAVSITNGQGSFMFFGTRFE